MRIAHLSGAGPGGTGRLLAAAAALLRERGLRLAGTEQVDSARAGRSRCDMDLRLLPDGPLLRISADRGEHARGCRLDPGALEQAALEVARRLEGADCLIVNRFGKREAEGRGLVPAVAQALERGLPVLVGVGPRDLAAFLAFSGGLSTALPPDPAAAAAWCLEGRPAHAA